MWNFFKCSPSTLEKKLRCFNKSTRFDRRLNTEVVYKIYDVGCYTRKNKKSNIWCVVRLSVATMTPKQKKMFVTIDFVFVFVVQPYLSSEYRNYCTSFHYLNTADNLNTDHGIAPFVEMFLHLISR